MFNLSSIMWHDLPLDQISIKSDSFELVITPFNELTKEYDVYTFKLFSFLSLSLSIESQLDLAMLKEMEITSFEYTLKNGKLSGTIGILPANAGFWSISFEDARWSINSST